MRTNRPRASVLAVVFLAAVALGGVAPRLLAARGEAPAPAQTVVAELESLRAEINQLRDQLPGQAHVMIDIGQHFSGLWFAVQNRNWDLATFMFNETSSHLRWAVRVRPKRKLADGNWRASWRLSKTG